jgi:hypothetical protein
MIVVSAHQMCGCDQVQTCPHQIEWPISMNNYIYIWEQEEVKRHVFVRPLPIPYYRPQLKLPPVKRQMIRDGVRIFARRVKPLNRRNH